MSAIDRGNESTNKIVPALLRGGPPVAEQVMGRGEVLEIAQIWRDVILDVQQFSPKTQFVTVGGGADFLTPGLADAKHKLVLMEAGDFVVVPPEGWLMEGGPTVSEKPIRLRHNEVVFVIRMARPARRFAGRVERKVDTVFASLLSFSTFSLGMLAILGFTAPQPEPPQIFEQPDWFAEVMLDKPEPEPEPLEVTVAPQAVSATKPDPSPPGVAGPGVAGPSPAGDLGQLRADQDAANSAGLLGAWDAMEGVLGESGLSADLVEGTQGLIGQKGGLGGTVGFSSRGDSLGGVGAIGSIAQVGRPGVVDGAPEGGQFSAKEEGRITQGENQIIIGAMDRSLVSGVIQRHMNRFRYCYQRELTRDPTLGGKITVRFIIGTDGGVSKASIKSSSMGNVAVERCLSQRFMQLQFPEVPGGGIVIVNYPFIFSS